jgi:TFIIF-interacting CTD phosphatase-like protein
MENVVSVCETIDTHANNEEQYNEDKNNSVSAKLDKKTHLSNQCQAHQQDHHNDAGVGI